jgi:KDO2-lipid IV(A) lauroyltransferase
MTTKYRCGVDLVDINQVQQLVDNASSDDLKRIFSEREINAAGMAKTRYARLAARFAAKEACLKLFPAETATAAIDCSDFCVDNDAYGAPFISLSPKARALLDLHGIEDISISLSHTHGQAIAMAVAIRKDFEAPLIGKLIYRLLPIRRRLILANLQRVYGNTLTAKEIKAIAQAHYAHFVRMGLEFVQFQFLSKAQREARARVENAELIINTLSKGQGAIILTGHFGNFATAIAAGSASFPEARGRFYFVRRPLQPQWVDSLIGKHFERSGFSSLPKRGSMEAILDCLEAGNALVFPFDQFATGKGSIKVDFFGYPTGTFRSLALIALTSRAPVFPASSWRDENGNQVVRFEEALHLVEAASAKEEIRLNTRLFNASLERLVLRHPDQWWWVHRRWRK